MTDAKDLITIDNFDELHALQAGGLTQASSIVHIPEGYKYTGDFHGQNLNEIIVKGVFDNPEAVINIPIFKVEGSGSVACKDIFAHLLTTEENTSIDVSRDIVAYDDLKLLGTTKAKNIIHQEGRSDESQATPTGKIIAATHEQITQMMTAEPQRP